MVSCPATNHHLIVIAFKTPSSVCASISTRPVAYKNRWDAWFSCCVCVLAFSTFPYALAHTSQRHLPSILRVHDERNQNQKKTTSFTSPCLKASLLYAIPRGDNDIETLCQRTPQNPFYTCPVKILKFDRYPAVESSSLVSQ
jgi:hypothetical protein